MPFRFDNSLQRELDGFFVPWQAAAAPAPRLTIYNHALAATLGLPAAEEAQLAAWFSGAEPVPGSETVALAYAGHQFGHFNPQMGDGRALLLGEVIAPSGARFDLHFKGSGATPFSRGADGKCALGPALREYLISEAMATLEVPTTRSLAVATTGEGIWREQAHPGAVLTRVAASHLRVGTFEFAAAHKGLEGVQKLTAYSLTRHYPHAIGARNPALALLEAVCEAQAALVAKWMNLGFVHGVMNTDNVTISGETIDYGPCAFLDAYSAHEVFSSIDRGGRYAFGQQPLVCRWNMYRLASALIEAIAAVDESDAEAARVLLEEFPARYQHHWLAGLRPKLGLMSEEAGDLELGEALFAALEGQQADFTQLFRALSASLGEGYDPVAAEVTDRDAFAPWFARWQQRLAREPLDPAARAARMDAVNPLYIPRNHRVDAALKAAEAGDLSPFLALLEVVTHPFGPRSEWDDYALAPAGGTPHFVTYCGT
jgi:serine/tyrosine/threonine adenylyltransferase